ncbi:MAG TPA: NAD(P)/FAD-dependent oxidoreductase [Gemmatimonadaceae bacterium]
MKTLPGHVAFIGAGYVSLEFAFLANAAGSRVTILGCGRPLAAFDETLVDRLLDHARSLGIDVRLGSPVTGVERAGHSGRFRIAVAGGAQAPDDADLVVHGAGRIPNTAKLALAAGQVLADPRGAIEVNEYLQSVSNPRVYAAGDVVLPPGAMPLTPVAAHHGAVVASNLLKGNSARADYRGIPSVVFTLPPLASVGLTEAEARRRTLDVRVETGDTTGWFSNRHVREPVGMFKTIIDSSTDRMLGAHLLGRHAAETINAFALAVRFGLTARDLRHAIYSYPTATSDLPYMV